MCEILTNFKFKFLKARCHTCFQHALTAWCCVFKVNTLAINSQCNYLKMHQHAVNAR